MKGDSKRWPAQIVVILNDQARRVTRRVKGFFLRWVPKANLYISRTKEEAYAYIQEVLDRGTKILFTGGGDGTLAATLTMIKRYIEEKGEQLRLYADDLYGSVSKSLSVHLGILRLGTGNGWAYAVASPRRRRAIQRLLERGAYTIRRFNIIESRGQWFHFSGLGWDAKILNDYVRLRDSIKVQWLRRCFEGLRGYLITIFTRTIPSVLRRRSQVEVTVTSLGDSAYRIDSKTGEERAHYPKGTVLYQGKVNVIGVGSVPYYGYRLKAFPFADSKEGLMQLRIVKAGVLKLIAHAKTIWQGRFRSPDFLDFMVQKVELAFSEPMPLQIGGDAEGYVQKIRYAVAPYQVNVIDCAQGIS